LIKNSLPFGKKLSENLRGDFFDSHCSGNIPDRRIRYSATTVATLLCATMSSRV